MTDETLRHAPVCKWCELPLVRDNLDSFWTHRFPSGSTGMLCSVLGHAATHADEDE